MWGATKQIALRILSPCISIHAPRVRCDSAKGSRTNPPVYFNPRTSCEVRRLKIAIVFCLVKFQSTHLVWGATFFTGAYGLPKHISIHAPRVRCDVLRHKHLPETSYFNPRTSCEVRLTLWKKCQGAILFQSTHLVWGATLIFPKIIDEKRNFNPRTSCEVRRSNSKTGDSQYLFQSTHLVWGATDDGSHTLASVIISIHAPRVRCDFSVYRYTFAIFNFNPRTSCEVRLC